jgi:hypothetical protein
VRNNTWSKVGFLCLSHQHSCRRKAGVVCPHTDHRMISLCSPSYPPSYLLSFQPRTPPESQGLSFLLSHFHCSLLRIPSELNLFPLRCFMLWMFTSLFLNHLPVWIYIHPVDISKFYFSGNCGKIKVHVISQKLYQKCTLVISKY